MKSLATALFVGLLTAATASAQCTWVNQTTSDVETCGSVGVGTTNPTSQVHVLSNVNGAAPQVTVQNIKTGVGAAANLQVVNDAGVACQFGVTSSTWTPLGSIGPSAPALYTNGSNGLMLIADNPAGSLRFLSGGHVEKARFDPAGNLGIGTTTPVAKLHVVGNAQFDGTVSGTFIKAQYQDVAEWVPAKTSLDSGTVVVLDPAAGNGVMASFRSYDTTVAGVVSAQPGIVLGQEGESKEKVATTGRVRVKVDASNGAITVGDLLVTSDKPGFAMRSVPVQVSGISMHRPGTIIGKALESLPSGAGEILVLLSLQ